MTLNRPSAEKCYRRSQLLGSDKDAAKEAGGTSRTSESRRASMANMAGVEVGEQLSAPGTRGGASQTAGRLR
jgi:hypothetical protein